LLLVTHKPSVLSVVNRVIVVSRGQIVMDGPRDAVLAQLTQNSQTDSVQKRSIEVTAPGAAVSA
jgi:ATP-binding cassette subfamily C protein LapB